MRAPLPPDVAGALVEPLAVLFVVYGIYTLIGVLVALTSKVTVTGGVLWVGVWRRTKGSKDHPSVPWSHYLAIDDGTSERTVAWACPSAVAETLVDGDVVTFTARRWTRRVEHLRIDRAAPRPTSIPLNPGEGKLDTSYDAEQFIAENLRPQVPKGWGRSGKLTPARLMTDEEVSRALGRPVTSTGLADNISSAGAMAENYRDPTGEHVLSVMVSTGWLVPVAMSPLSKRHPLPGIGEEAYAGPKWVVGKRDGHVLSFYLHGSAVGTPTTSLAWLLGLALSRLPHGLPAPPRE
jgi:hypothetical protein